MKLSLASLAVVALSAVMCLSQEASKNSAQNPGFPRVVARLNLFNRTKAIGPETLYTPSKAGVFRISVAMVCTVANPKTDGYWSSEVIWQNETGQAGPLSVADVFVQSIQYSPNSQPFVFDAMTGYPLVFQITPHGDTSGSQYNAYIILEQLE
jgi:hypothetical protein